MKISAIRGATTILADTPEEIKQQSVQLYTQIIAQNRLKPKHIICIIAGSTNDIKSYYPATALRLSGLAAAPLFSTVEPDINDSLPMCIRLLVMARCKNPKHVYLNKAANLLSKNDINPKQFT